MKRIILVVAVLVFAAPALAAVDITCTVVGDEITVEYNASGEPNLVRAFALDITVDGDAVIESMSDFNPDYYIYPGSIVILDGEVNDYGSPICDPCQYAGTEPGLNSNSVTIEMGSLYVGEANDPDDSGILFKFKVDRGCNVAITENPIRGGVVLEDGSTPGINAPGCTSIDCMKGTHPDHANWLHWDKPKCWCYARQCRGDANGKKQGPFWVYTQDLLTLKGAYGKLEAQMPAGGECADFNRSKQGPFWVYTQDLLILKGYYGQIVVPECDKTDIEFWVVP